MPGDCLWHVYALAGELSRAHLCTVIPGHRTKPPALTSTPRTVTFTETGTYSNCVSANPLLTSGSFNATVAVPGDSCLAPPNIALNNPGTLNWNNGGSSTGERTGIEVIVEGDGEVIGTGCITSGQFAVDTLTMTWTPHRARPSPVHHQHRNHHPDRHHPRPDRRPVTRRAGKDGAGTN